MKLVANLQGDKAVKEALKKLAVQYPLALGAALYQEGMTVWNLAVKKAPVQYGVLRNSAYVSPPMKQSGDVMIEVGFGTKYAVFQHEREGLNHPRGGEAGYLRKALAEVMSGYLERLVKRTEANVKNNVRAPAIQAPTAPRASSSGRRKSSKRLRKARAKRGNR